MTSMALKNPTRSIITTLWLLIFDFDRTLFDTQAYNQDFLEWVQTHISPVTALAAQQAERRGNFDMFDFLERRGYRKEKVRENFARYIQKKYRGTNHSYLLPGALSLIRFAQAHPELFFLAIITTGSDFNQNFKRLLCPEIEGIPFLVIPGNKGEMIQNSLLANNGRIEFAGWLFDRFMVADDKSENIRAIQPLTVAEAEPPRMLFHVIRPDGKDSAPTGRRDIQRVNDLSSIERTLRSLAKSQAA